MATTLKQIAEHCGVSVPTVHKVLNNYKAPFAAETRARVLAAAKKLDYKPNLVARSLRNQRSMLIGVLLSEFHSVDSIPIMLGVQDVVTEQSYSPIIFTHRDAAEERKCLQLALDRQVDALILAPDIDDNGLTNREALTQPAVLKLPRVELLGRFVPDVPYTLASSQAMIDDAVGRLVEAGHERIGIVLREDYKSQIAKSALWWHIRDFVEAFEESLVKNPSVRPSYHLYGRSNMRRVVTQAAVFKALDEAFTGDDPPTALLSLSKHFFEATVIYGEVYPERLPPDFTITCEYDADTLRGPHVKTLRLKYPAEAIGRRAARMVLDRINGKDVESYEVTEDDD